MRELSEAEQAWAEHVNNLEASAAARNDAKIYGTGWLRVDPHGRLERIDPTRVSIHIEQEKSE